MRSAENQLVGHRSSEVYRADDVSEPLPEIPGISLVAESVCEDLRTGSVKMALVTAELPGRHRTLFVVFKGSSYLLDFINWNLEHDYEVIGDGKNFMHKGAAGIMRNLFFLKVQPTSTFAKQLDSAYSSGVRHLVLTGHSLGGMYAMSGMYFIWKELQTLLPAAILHLHVTLVEASRAPKQTLKEGFSQGATATLATVASRLGICGVFCI